MLHLGALVHPREPFPHLLCFSISISDFNYNSGTWNSQMAFVGLARPNLVLDFTRNRKRSNDHSQRGGWDSLQIRQWPHNSTANWTKLSPCPAEDHSVLTAGFQGVFMVCGGVCRGGIKAGELQRPTRLVKKSQCHGLPKTGPDYFEHLWLNALVLRLFLMAASSLVWPWCHPVVMVLCFGCLCTFFAPTWS